MIVGMTGSRFHRASARLHELALRAMASLSTLGVLTATLFFAFSLTPSLSPRSMLLQGVVSGLSLSLGYLLGWTMRWLWSALELPEPGPRTHRIALVIAASLCVLIAAWFLWRASEWQNSVRLLMNMPPVETVRPYKVALISLAIFIVALLFARGFRLVFRLLARILKRVVPPRLAYIASLVMAAALFWSLMEGVLVSGLLRLADSSYQQLDALVPDDVDAPKDPRKTGSPASLIRWQDLGRQGRLFVARGPSAADIAGFTDEYAYEPLRVYVGLNAADTPEQRAQLALRELIRVGGFERSLLLIITPTGTGWVQPEAIDALEYLHRGDVASVAAQYSYLPSPLALVAEGAYGAETAQALFQAVYAHWAQLPEERRPKLYLHGLSLGAVNSEQSFHLHDVLGDPIHGALWAGPPFRSRVWNIVTRNRRPDSPQWLPKYRDESIVRFMNQYVGVERPGIEWGPLRVVYLQHASDPVSFFSIEAAWREPDWMRAPRAPDISPELRWYPLVTMLQLAADMVAGGEAVPPGYGHHFSAHEYIEAWHALTEPAGWQTQDLRRLGEALERRADVE